MFNITAEQLLGSQDKQNWDYCDSFNERKFWPSEFLIFGIIKTDRIQVKTLSKYQKAQTDWAYRLRLAVSLSNGASLKRCQYFVNTNQGKKLSIIFVPTNSFKQIFHGRNERITSPTVHRQSADTSPTPHWLSAVCRLTVHQQNCRLTDGRQTADRWPTDGR